MDTHSPITSPTSKRPLSNTLALVSLATFWAIPFSAIFILITLKVVPKGRSWPRRITHWAAALCTLYTIMIATWVLVMAVYIFIAKSS